jgi:hypothetical protein
LIISVSDKVKERSNEKLGLAAAINALAKIADFDVVMAPHIIDSNKTDPVLSGEVDPVLGPISVWVYAKLMICVRSNQNIKRTDIIA